MLLPSPMAMRWSTRTVGDFVAPLDGGEHAATDARRGGELIERAALAQPLASDALAQGDHVELVIGARGSFLTCRILHSGIYPR